MRKLSAMIAGLCLTGFLSHSLAATANATQQFIDSYSKTYTDLGLGGEMDLSYVKNIQSLVKSTDRARQTAAFDTLSRQLKALDTRDSNLCQRMQLQQIGFEVELNQQKLALLEKYVALGDKAVLSDKGLIHTTLGKEWYAYLRKAWLTMDTTPDALMAMGRSELDRALARYAALQSRMGYAGRDKAFALYLDSPAFRYPEGTTPQADYEERQATVYQNLHKLFVPTSIQPPQIRQSDLGAAMPVDGYYEPDERTFYFNKAKASFERRNIDWLLLHESTPGHHYQSSYVLEKRGCPGGLPHIFYSAYGEGWGAYVEEFGAELGLFKHDADALGAVEWDLVRSIRVVLDVGINHLGWTEQQARDYWQSKLPMLPALADREIKRVRDWPVQAITYKQGAVMFRQLRSTAQAQQGASFDIRTFHDSVLRNGPVPLAMLTEMVQTARPLAQ
jgi:uncharacterized protein (DUF885 family)